MTDADAATPPDGPSAASLPESASVTRRDDFTVASQSVRAGRTHAALLPGRPPHGADWGGPEKSGTNPKDAKHPARAICCSGGGIRSAAFALGGLQYLTLHAEGDSTVYRNTDFITSVSGGGYTAGSYALVQHHLTDEDTKLPPYAPGSQEDNHLRAHTRYLIDSKTQLTISVLGIIYGLVMNLAAILCAVFFLAKLTSTVLGPHGLNALRLASDGSTFSAHFPSGLIWALTAVLGAGALVYFLYRLVDMWRSHPFGEVGTKRWCVAAIWLIAAALIGMILLLGVPALLVLLNHAPSKVSRAGGGAQTGTIIGTSTALVAIVQQIVRTYAPTSSGESVNPVGAAAAKKAGPLASRVGNALLPWLGSALIVALLAVALLTWVSDGVKSPHQTLQWWIFGGCVVFLLIWKVFTDGNRTSLHSYYTQRLATAFAVDRNGTDHGGEDEKFSAYAPDRPHLVLCAAVNTDQPGGTPSGRNCAPFTFSPFNAGISSGTMFNENENGVLDLGARETEGPDRVDWNNAARPTKGTSAVGLSMPTRQLEDASRLSLMDMIAVSGAAVSPAMGRISRPSLRLVLGVANVRLGMWLPNPLHKRYVKPAEAKGSKEKVREALRRQLRQPGPLALVSEIVGGLSLKGRWVYVTDGGHYENLGLVEALRRGATDVIAFDASADKPFTLATFGEAVETARADLGIEITLDDPNALAQVKKTGLAHNLAARATATYANGVEARIYLCKAAMVRDLPLDVVAWKEAHPAFPNTSTVNQFYGDREFEAYRKLGWTAAAQACQLRGSPNGSSNLRRDGDVLSADPLLVDSEQVSAIKASAAKASAGAGSRRAGRDSHRSDKDPDHAS